MLEGIDRALAAVVARAEEHRRRSASAARTASTPSPRRSVSSSRLGVRARPRAHARRARARGHRVGKLSGAVGTYAAIDPEVERIACERLGLEPAPASTQILQRDRHAELLAALAVSRRRSTSSRSRSGTSRAPRCARSQEPFGAGQKGSSAMPHKRNPVVAERICGLARVVRGAAVVGFENVALWHERDISHSSAERVVIPDAFLALDYMLDRFAWLVEGLVVHPERMRRNLDASHGLYFSQRLLLALVESGLERDEAYRLVQRNAMRAWDEELDFRELVRADPEIAACRPRRRLRHEPRTRNMSTSSSIVSTTRQRSPFMPETVARRERQGSRDLRARRRAPAARRERPHLDLRRRPPDRDPGQGPRADGPLRLLVRAHEAHRPEPPARAARRRPLDRVPAARDAARRVRRARLHHRLGLEGLPRDAARSAGTGCRKGCASRSGCPSRSSRRRRRLRPGHDENITREQAAELVGASASTKSSGSRSSSTRFAAAHAEARGIILADTKFELGVDDDGQLVLADEAFTPDSSRFWPADAYEPGGPQPSFDKQYVRDYCESVGWDKTYPGPELPDDVVAETRAKYVEAFERLTGISFDDYVADPDVVLR